MLSHIDSLEPQFIHGLHVVESLGVELGKGLEPPLRVTDVIKDPDSHRRLPHACEPLPAHTGVRDMGIILDAYRSRGTQTLAVVAYQQGDYAPVKSARRGITSSASRRVDCSQPCWSCQ